MTELTLATLEDFVRANKFAVVHFWAPWNGYDVEMKKLLATQIPQDLSPNFVIGTLNIDSVEHNHLSRFHEIKNLPFLAFYRDGLLVDALTGMRQADDIVERLTRAFA
jgi:thioredoxin-like negative regulator of GroEL